MPERVKLVISFDQSSYIRSAVKALEHEALQGGGLAVLVILVFLLSLRATGIVAVAIPLSIIATFVLLDFAGQSLNIFTLGGLALGVGRLVYDSIVELEKIHRHLLAEPTRKQAVLKAARKVFEEKGLDGASIRLIAHAAGCTTGSIYPYFKGKEEIYAELLSASLQDYERFVTARVVKVSSPAARFEAALTAHFDFYEKRRGDMSLALYLFNGLKPQGLTRQLDARLNAQLKAIRAIFAACVRELSGATAKEIDDEVGLHLAMLFGLLTLHHTKRTRVLGTDARALLQRHIRQTLERMRK